ncbi:hypothetical protein E2C01_083039 [Portunus trituberculatus]|uniref:Uncharacterized protein n=1 Tax=Portunus trituberculatus TaxID=210409 RepID=A0A5B7J030_PORTR|nr:hypothetical protein [Portunus trituberculatus]
MFVRGERADGVSRGESLAATLFLILEDPSISTSTHSTLSCSADNITTAIPLPPPPPPPPPLL